MEPLSNDIRTICFLNGPFPASFFYFRFSSQLTAHKCSMQKFADDWIRTADLWCWKRPLYQLSPSHCPIWTICYLVKKNFSDFRVQEDGQANDVDDDTDAGERRSNDAVDDVVHRLEELKVSPVKQVALVLDGAGVSRDVELKVRIRFRQIVVFAVEDERQVLCHGCRGRRYCRRRRHRCGRDRCNKLFLKLKKVSFSFLRSGCLYYFSRHH